MDAFEDSFDSNQDSVSKVLSPAAKLYFANIPNDYKDQIISGLINEAMVAREILLVNRSTKTIGVSDSIKHLGLYAEVRMQVDDAFRAGGSSSEVIRINDESDEVDKLLQG